MGPYIQGLTIGLAYVAPIGMQNLFVINAALTRTRRNALATALVVICFDVALSLACFFGVGALMQAHPWLERVVLGFGGLVVIRIGVGLVLFRKTTEPASDDADSAPSARLGARGLLDTVGTACVVTWFNPQAIIDGTLMLGAFAATLHAGQDAPFITGVASASVLWFLGVTLVVNAFAHRFRPKVIDVLNRVCGGVITLYGIKLLVGFVLAMV